MAARCKCKCCQHAGYQLTRPCLQELQLRIIELGPDCERTGGAITRAVGEALQSCSLHQVRDAELLCGFVSCCLSVLTDADSLTALVLVLLQPVPQPGSCAYSAQ